MTDDASPDEPKAGPKGGPKGDADLARFLQDWTELWREELRAQATDPEKVPLGMLAEMAKGGMTPDMSAAMEMWRTAMVAWSDTLGVPPSSMARSRDRPATPRAAAAPAAPDARDAEVERLARRIDELEARLAKLEPVRRRRG